MTARHDLRQHAPSGADPARSDEQRGSARLSAVSRWRLGAIVLCATLAATARAGTTVAAGQIVRLTDAPHAAHASHGVVHALALLAAPRPPSAGVLRTPALHATRAGTFWAGGFTPGESVAVSWGASNQGTVRANRDGRVNGALAIVGRARRGVHVLGLYGLTSHRVLTQVLDTTHHRRSTRGHQRKQAPPLLLAPLPGPLATVTPPLLKRTVRVPVSAAALPLGALVVMGLLIRRRRKRRKARAAARRPAKRRR